MKSLLECFQEGLNLINTQFDSFKSQFGIIESLLARVSNLEKLNENLLEKVEDLTEKLNKFEHAAGRQDSLSQRHVRNDSFIADWSNDISTTPQPHSQPQPQLQSPPTVSPTIPNNDPHEENLYGERAF
jgi:hypothetical protein